MIVYVPGRMPRHVEAAARLGAYQPGYYGRQLLLVRPALSCPPSPPSSPPSSPSQQLLARTAWPRGMPHDEEMLGVTGQRHGPVVVDGPPSPAHSDSDASSSSLELGSLRTGEHAQLKCR
jgi:hypothetical protein